MVLAVAINFVSWNTSQVIWYFFNEIQGENFYLSVEYMEVFFKRKKKHCFSGGKLVKNIFQENSDGTGWVQEIRVYDRFGYAVYETK